MAIVLGLLLFVLGCSGARSMRPHPSAVAQSLPAQVQMAQIGPVASGALAEGGVETHSVTVSAKRCYAVVVTGEFPLADIAVSVTGSDGEVLARDMMDGSVAMVQFCPEKSEELTLSVKAEAGNGFYRYGLFAALPADGDASLLLSGRGDGTCGSPYRLTEGKLITGDTFGVRPLLSTGCTKAEGPEAVFAIDIEEVSSLAVAVNTAYDRVLTVTPACGDLTEDVLCSRASRGSSTVNTPPLSPGRYFVILDGQDPGDRGPFTLLVRSEVQPSPEKACAAAKPLPFNKTLAGSTMRSPTVFRGSCARHLDAPEDVYSFTVKEPSRFRVGAETQFSSLIYLRKNCADSSGEVLCVDDRSVAAVLPPGVYSLFIDGDNSDAFGDYRLEAELLPVRRAGVTNDDLEHASPISSESQRKTFLTQDTFRATDNLSASCGGVGGPDVVYRFDLAGLAEVKLISLPTTYDGIYYILKREAERTVEVTCADNLPQSYSGILEKGTYYVAIDGKSENNFGASELSIEIRDLAETESVCKKAAPLKLGRKRSGSLSATDNFNSENGRGSRGRDAVFKLTVSTPTRVGILVEAAFDGYLYLRTDCPGGREVAINDDFWNATSSYIEETLSPGTYYVFVDSRNVPITDTSFTVLAEKI